MIKLVAASVWVAGVTVGALFYAFQAASTPPATHAESTAFGGLDYVRADILSVPQMRGGEVHGYFLARLVYVAGAERLRALALPANALLTDAAYTHLYADPSVDFSRTDEFDLEAFRNGLRTAINARVGEELIREVLVEQIDFLSKADIRRASFRGWDAAAAQADETAADSH